jgi:hypothetical protein
MKTRFLKKSAFRTAVIVSKQQLYILNSGLVAFTSEHRLFILYSKSQTALRPLLVRPLNTVQIVQIGAGCSNCAAQT